MGGLPGGGGGAPEAPQTTGNGGEGTTFALPPGYATQGRGMTSGTPRGPSPLPAPLRTLAGWARATPPGRPRPAVAHRPGPAASATGAAHSLLLRHLLASADLRDHRVGRRGASGACGCFRLPLRAEAGPGRPGRPSGPSSRWPESGDDLGDFLGAGPARAS